MQFLVAPLTPFDPRGRVDLVRLRAHVLWLASQGVGGFVTAITAGELPYLSDREREAVHRTVLDAARGLPVFACVWDPAPETVKWLVETARDLGASGALLPPPMYYELPEPLVEAWYSSFAETAPDFPLIAWHVPKHVPTGISEALYAKLRASGAISGMLDASGDMFRLQRLCASDPGTVMVTRDKLLPSVQEIRQNAGFVSSLANAWPQFCLRVARGEHQLAEALADRAARVRRAGGLRALKALLGMGSRAPMLPPGRDLLDGLPPAERP